MWCFSHLETPQVADRGALESTEEINYWWWKKTAKGGNSEYIPTMTSITNGKNLTVQGSDAVVPVPGGSEQAATRRRHTSIAVF